jgi:hypothetical protein
MIWLDGAAVLERCNKDLKLPIKVTAIVPQEKFSSKSLP